MCSNFRLRIILSCMSTKFEEFSFSRVKKPTHEYLFISLVLNIILSYLKSILIHRIMFSTSFRVDYLAM
jgi:hypothetical protein